MNEDMMQMQPMGQVQPQQEQAQQMINRQELARLKEIEKIYNIQMKTMGRPIIQPQQMQQSPQQPPIQQMGMPIMQQQPQENVITSSPQSAQYVPQSYGDVITSFSGNAQKPYVHEAFQKRHQNVTKIPQQQDFDEVEIKIKRYMDSQQYAKKSRFSLPFMKKKIPKHKAQDKFDEWLKKKCEHDCYVCDDCEKKLREIINEGWLWIEKLNLS